MAAHTRQQRGLGSACVNLAVLRGAHSRTGTHGNQDQEISSEEGREENGEEIAFGAICALQATRIPR
jgi:hypothetical protein